MSASGVQAFPQSSSSGLLMAITVRGVNGMCKYLEQLFSDPWRKFDRDR